MGGISSSTSRTSTAEAVDAVRRLWIDGSTARIYYLARDGQYRLLEVYTRRPAAPDGDPGTWAALTTGQLVERLRAIRGRLGDTPAYRSGRAALAARDLTGIDAADLFEDAPAASPAP